MDSQIIYQLASLFIVIAAGPLVIFLLAFSDGKL
uniref:Photosystem II reaction center protein Psb30 n=1 Tax=Caulerpa verticillata TaxID=177082 RepID=A0A386B0G4_9CHLO|nr:photosystem II protein psb30 [Caulerpa verticillata]AYC65180.1 photosystem II protein psb30 [Caulerpa verticillata]